MQQSVVAKIGVKSILNAPTPDKKGVSQSLLMKPRRPNCALCRNHGQIVRSKAHKRYCPWKECSCKKCTVTTDRRKVVASQIAARRAKIQDLERDKELAQSSNKQIQNGNCVTTVHNNPINLNEHQQMKPSLATVPQGFNRFIGMHTSDVGVMYARDYLAQRRLYDIQGTIMKAASYIIHSQYLRHYQAQGSSGSLSENPHST